MLTRLSVLSLALLGVAGIAHAQTYNSSMPSGSMQSNGQERYQAVMPDSGTHAVAITDEYGFKYDSRGDRLDSRGHVIAPPMTPPGARALK
jgi:hypothetical protein